MNQRKIALVTGANKGIGLEICRQLAKAGLHVILSARNAAAGEAACQELAKTGASVEFLQLDVSDARSIAQATETLRQRHGRLDILVNNAGILPDEDGPGLQVSPETVQQVFRTNTLGPLTLSQQMAPLLKKSGSSGQIINVSSGMGSLNDMDGGYAAYRISKTALNAVTGILARELQGSGVAVNSVCPGWVRTDMGGQSAERPVEKGAVGIVQLALSETPPSGKFLRDGQLIEW